MRHAIVVALAFVGACSSGRGVGARPATEAAGSSSATVQPEVVPASTIPDTPAGKVLRAWLDVFDRGDEAGVQAFVARYKPDFSAPDMLRFRERTGGFELLAIQRSEPLAIEFVVREKARPRTAVGWLKLSAASTPEIALLTVLVVPRGMTAAQMSIAIDAATRTRVIAAIVAKLTEAYVYPDVAKRMAAALRAHEKRGAYDAVDDGLTFAKRLTEQLQAVSRDRHLSVEFVLRALPEREPEPTDDDRAQLRAHLDQVNCGFQKAERLDGNVGYLKFDMFGDAAICGPKATAAFAAIGDVDALVVDLRDNGGGHPEMVAFVSSYLFAKRTHLNDLYDRKQNKTTQYWTRPDVPGAKLARQPVYVLTSQRTFSGAEEFAYNLQQLKRATIIGEVTGGGAHPTMGARLDDHFMIGVPFARAINPITKTNWEGTGVEPDVKVPADRALDTAKQLAADQLAKPRVRKP